MSDNDRLILKQFVENIDDEYREELRAALDELLEDEEEPDAAINQSRD